MVTWEVLHQLADLGRGMGVRRDSSDIFRAE